MKVISIIERIAKMYRVSFTGYREWKLPFPVADERMEKLKRRITETVLELVEEGADVFFSGMALGVDTYAAESVLEAKKTHSDINLIAVLPCPEQDSRWTDVQKKKYREILEQCDKVMTISPRYDKECMHRRNRALVDLCDVLVAVYDGLSGGTRYTVDYAKKSGRKVIEIHLDEL